MENQEQLQGQDRVRRLILTLRSITLAVQIIPFIYASLFVLDFILYASLSEQAQQVFDTLFYTSPFVAASNLVFSKILHLCKWHKTACVLPLFPQAVSFVDYYIIELTEIEALVTDFLTLTMVILLIVAAYNVFLKPRRK